LSFGEDTLQPDTRLTRYSSMLELNLF
jgi:hypothetical protein